jgi:hypothetical protein
MGRPWPKLLKGGAPSPQALERELPLAEAHDTEYGDCSSKFLILQHPRTSAGTGPDGDPKHPESPRK